MIPKCGLAIRTARATAATEPSRNSVWASIAARSFGKTDNRDNKRTNQPGTRQATAATDIHQTAELPRSTLAGQKHTAQPAAITTVSRTADLKTLPKLRPVTRREFPC